MVSIDEALSLAREAGLDLVEVSPQESPPVCRIMDYGKHLYERKKRQKVATQAHVTTLKEIRIRPKTDTHDRGVKLTHAREFLDHGHKVQFTMLFRGRERFFRDRATEVFDEIIAELGEAAKVERPPLMDGRRMTMVIGPGKRKAGSGGTGGSEGGHAPASNSPASAPTQPAPSPLDVPSV